MPGISFICDLKGNLGQKKSTILQSLNSVIHTEHYESRILLNENFYFLGYTGYKEYPITCFENEEFCIYLEGRIYGKDRSATNSELNLLAHSLFDDLNRTREQIAEWLLRTDGDFVVFVFHKQTNEIAILNDALGRLPLYYVGERGRIILSRELRFVAAVLGDNHFDRMGIVQFLLFGFLLGKRTLLENVSSLQGATLIRINLNNSEIVFDTLCQFNFEQMEDQKIDFQQSLDNLIGLFLEACENRISLSSKNLVALSGGVDSRSVAAGLWKIGAPVLAATRLSFDGREKFDAKLAELVARGLSLDWRLFELGPVRGKDLLKLLRIKSGLNSLAISFTIPFLERVKETYGPNVTFFTGDGGDRIKPHFKSAKNVTTLDEVVHYAISQNQTFSLEDVSALTNLTKSQIIDDLKHHICSYPEEGLKHKYIHFQIYESAFRGVFEAEDRNRFFFWSVTPFYSVRFLRCAMSFADGLKKRYRLYREFLCRLAPQISKMNCIIDNVNWNLPITSTQLTALLLMKSVYSAAPSQVRIYARKLLARLGEGLGRSRQSRNAKKHNQNLIRCIGKQLKKNGAIFRYLSHPELNSIIRNQTKYDRNKILNLFTIISAIEEFEGGGSTIEEYCESIFM